MIGLYLVLIFQFLGVASVFAAESVDTKLQPTSNQGMVLIPGGEFMMGSDKALSRPDERKRPARPSIPSFSPVI